MTREEAIKELERISEDTVQRECSTCGRLHIGTYNGICALCSLCECVPDYAKEYHKKYQTVSRWKWNGRWANEALDMAIAALREQEERSKGCSACDGGFGDNTMVFYAGGYKHCPMCGRRLEDT